LVNKQRYDEIKDYFFSVVRAGEATNGAANGRLGRSYSGWLGQ